MLKPEPSRTVEGFIILIGVGLHQVPCPWNQPPPTGHEGCGRRGFIGGKCPQPCLFSFQAVHELDRSVLVLSDLYY